MSQDPQGPAGGGESGGGPVGGAGGADLTGSFLIAMPGMQDPRFRHSLVFLCAHSERGAMGVIVNKPLPGASMRELLEQLDIEPAPEAAPAEADEREDSEGRSGEDEGRDGAPPARGSGGGRRLGLVQFGGPVEMHRGFVLHSDDWSADDGTLEVAGGFALTATLDILKEMAAGRGPGLAMLALGYAGWGPGQLESELAQNGWLTAPADRRIVFELPNSRKWEAALATLGVDPLFLSAEGGTA